MPPLSQVTRQSKNGKQDNTGDILSRIKPVEFSEDGIKVLLYGKSGTGKTHLWSTFPGPIVALVSSGSMKPGELRTVNTQQNKGKVFTAVIKESLEITRVTEAIKEGTLECNTLVLDHATGFQDQCLAEILGVDVSKLPTQKGWGTATQQQWGFVTSLFKDCIREMLNLPINVVIIAHEKVFNPKEEQGDGEVLVKPFIAAGLTPNNVGWLNGAVDYVVQTFKRRKIEKVVTEVAEGMDPIVTERPTKEVEYCLKIGPDNVLITKFRVPLEIAKKLPDVIVDPTYSKLAKAIQGTLGQKLDKKGTKVKP